MGAVRRQPNEVPVSIRTSAFDWYFTWALAALTLLLMCAGLIVNIVTLAAGEEALDNLFAGAQFPITFAIMAMLFVVAVFWLWIKMLGDFFQNRPEKNPVAWGWALILLNIGAAVAYFWFVWRPRSDPKRLSVV
jgi:magnesium-transporting ATPase (P-type)